MRPEMGQQMGQLALIAANDFLFLGVFGAPMPNLSFRPCRSYWCSKGPRTPKRWIFFACQISCT